MKWKEVAVICAVAWILAALLFPVNTPLAATLHIVFGWISFLHRVLSHIQIDWSGVATVLGCLLLLCYGLHCFGRWMTTWPGESNIAWRWPKSPVLVVGVAALFWAGLTGVGLARSTHWLWQFDGPWFEHRGGSPRTQSINNLKQLALGMHFHHDVYKRLPPGATFDAQGRALHSWTTLLLPFIEQDHLFKKIELKLPWNHELNRAPFQQRISLCENPDVRPTLTNELPIIHYAGNVYVLGGRALRLWTDFPDGTSSTLLMGEVAGAFPPWGQPGNWRDPSVGINRGIHTFGNPRRDGAHFGLVDGSVRFVSEKVSLGVLKALATPAGGERINDAEWEQ